jgi:hypothetical protein
MAIHGSAALLAFLWHKFIKHFEATSFASLEEKQLILAVNNADLDTNEVA